MIENIIHEKTVLNILIITLRASQIHRLLENILTHREKSFSDMCVAFSGYTYNTLFNCLRTQPIKHTLFHTQKQAGYKTDKERNSCNDKFIIT